jgi:hypothetical protein
LNVPQLCGGAREAQLGCDRLECCQVSKLHPSYLIR